MSSHSIDIERDQAPEPCIARSTNTMCCVVVVWCCGMRQIVRGEWRRGGALLALNQYIVANRFDEPIFGRPGKRTRLFIKKTQILLATSLT